jgi:hypothetical protein
MKGLSVDYRDINYTDLSFRIIHATAEK